MSPSTAACPPWNPNSVFFFDSLTVTELAVNLSWDSRFKPVLGRLATGSCSWTYSGSLCSAVFSKSFFRLNDGVPLERNNTNNSSKTASRNLWRFRWLSNQPRLYSNRWSFNKVWETQVEYEYLVESYIRNDPTIANSWVSWVALTKSLHAAARFESRRIKVIFKKLPRFRTWCNYQWLCDLLLMTE